MSDFKVWSLIGIATLGLVAIVAWIVMLDQNACEAHGGHLHTTYGTVIVNGKVGTSSSTSCLTSDGRVIEDY